MAFQYSVVLRTNQVAQIQTTVATAGTTAMQCRIYSGTEPVDCNTAASGTLLATIVLPNPFLTSAAAVTTIAGVWSVAASAGGAGTNAGYFRIYDMAGTPVCHVQGNVTATGGGGDLQLNNISISTGQTVTVTQFSVTAGNGP